MENLTKKRCRFTGLLITTFICFGVQNSLAIDTPDYCDFTRQDSLNQDETDCIYTVNNPNSLIQFANTFVAEETNKEFEKDVIRKIAKKHMQDLLNHHFYTENELPAGDVSIKKWISRTNFVNLMKEKGLDKKCSALGGESKDFYKKVSTSTAMLEVSQMFNSYSSSKVLAREIQKAVIVENLLHLNPSDIPVIIGKYPHLFNASAGENEIMSSEYQKKLMRIYNRLSFSGSNKIKNTKGLTSTNEKARMSAAESVASVIGSGTILAKEGQVLIASKMDKEKQELLAKLEKVCGGANSDYYSHPEITAEIIDNVTGVDGKSLRKIYNLKRNNCQKLKALESAPSVNPILLHTQRLDIEASELSKMVKSKVPFPTTSIDFIGYGKPGTCYTTAFGSKRYNTDSSFKEFNNEDKKFENDDGDLEGSYSCEYECVRPNGKKDRFRAVHFDKVKKRNDNGKQFLCLSYKSPSALDESTVLVDGYMQKKVYSVNGKTVTIDPVNSRSRQLIEWGKKHYPNRVPAEEPGFFSNLFN
jgi:hypothetical protein